MTPDVNTCTHNCIFCWRSTQFTQTKLDDPDGPEFIIEEAIKAQRMMLSGFGGFEGADETRLKEAQTPNQAAISLSGEPTLYNYLPELTDSFHKRKFTTFVVSNATRPEMLERIKPTQLYITLPASDEETYKKICNPLIKDGWEKINESLDVLANSKTRTVIRLTLVRGLNMKKPKEYAKLIEKASPYYAEIKAYMAVGFSRERLGLNYMPKHEEIKKFAREIAEENGYIITDEHIPSRVVLLCRDKKAESKRFLNF